MCKVQIQLKQNCRRHLRLKITSILSTDTYTDGHKEGYTNTLTPVYPQNISFAGYNTRVGNFIFRANGSDEKMLCWSSVSEDVG